MYHKKTILTGLFLLLFSLSSFSQRFNFRQYDIEDGLTQSQVTAIAQDSKRRLWITTVGGLSCFNGKQFDSFTKTNGLNNNFTLALTVSKNNDIWVGTARGISKYNGIKFNNYKETKAWVSKLATDRSGKVYGLSSSQLFSSNESNTTFLKVTNDPAEIVTALKADQTGKIWVAVYRHGIYTLENNTWKPYINNNAIKDFIIIDFLTDQSDKNKTWVLSTTGIYTVEKGMLSEQLAGKYTAIEQDKYGNIWAGSSKGAYGISKNRVIHFDAKNGFSDNMVNVIFRDAENNIWLGTDGGGLFRFNDSNYVTFDESQGLQSKIVMSLAKGPSVDEIWMGTYGGLFSFKDTKISEIRIPSGKEESRNINFLYNDRAKNIWIGTINGGLWRYNGKRIEQMANDNEAIAYNTILEDSRGRIWLSTNAGCFMLDKSSKELSWISKEFGSTLLETTDGQIIVGTQDGAYLINNNQKISPIKIKQLAGSSILCMKNLGDVILFGTADNGMVIWDSKAGKVSTISTREGLASDHIYSILVDDKGLIWVGTGKGVNTLSSKTFKVMRNNPEHSLLVECNQNAILQHKDKIWVGTTKGAIVYTNNTETVNTSKPYIFINSVTAFAQNKKQQNNQQNTYREHELGHIISLPYNKNNLNINFTGIFLTNPDAVLYQYRLIGLDSKFSETITNTSTNFTAIPPGKYTFEVKAITKNGTPSLNTASFTFEITPPYYQTAIFRFLIFALIVLLILLAVYVIFNLKERKRRLRLKIKLEEQFKVRKQTAEDFHDDLGNKLTRISVLSEVLSSMIDIGDVEKRNIIQKINDNVNELYRGTKDILWSLNPKNDKLSELLNHIREFGREMFNETPICFEDHIDLAGLDGKLSLDMSRNMLMIFKEAIHNSLKHARATKISFSAIVNKEMLEITVKDDGQGINSSDSMDGHGINNMKVRAKRINAKLTISSDHTGTIINLNVNFSTLMRPKNV